MWQNAVLLMIFDCFPQQMRRMVFSVTLLAFCEVAKEDAAGTVKRAERQAEKKQEAERDGDILGVSRSQASSEDIGDLRQKAFAKLWKIHSRWGSIVLADAVAYAKDNEPRIMDSSDDGQEKEIDKVFYGSLWDSLKGRGWKEEETAEGRLFKFEQHKVRKRCWLLLSLSAWAFFSLSLF